MQLSGGELRITTLSDAGCNNHQLAPLAEAVLAVVGTTSPNPLDIEGGIDTHQASAAPVSLQSATNEVVGEDRVLSYKIDVDPGVTFLEVSDETQDYEPPDWPLDKDEVPLEPGAAPALLRWERPPPVAGGPPEAAAAVEGLPAPLDRRRRGPPRPRSVWRPSTPPAGLATGTQAADKQFCKDILAQQQENVNLERQCLLSKLKVSEEEAREARATCEAAEKVFYFRKQNKKMFALLGQPDPQQAPKGGGGSFSLARKLCHYSFTLYIQ